MLEITFRQMTPSDIDAVTELDKKSFGDDAWSRYIFDCEARNLHADYIVAEFTEKIIACAGMQFYDENAYITTLAVAAEFRRRGIAKKMLADLINSAKSYGAIFMSLEVRVNNFPSINLYEKFGFKILEREKNYYADGEDAFIMGLKL